MHYLSLAVMLVVLLVHGLFNSSLRAMVVGSSSLKSVDEQTLQDEGLPASGASLVDFFRQRSTNTIHAQEIAVFIQQLGDPTPAVQKRALASLLRLGPRAIPQLRTAANSLDDFQAAAQARRCLQSLEGQAAITLTTVAVHVLAASQPAGAVEALLTYLPHAEDEYVVEEIASALTNMTLLNARPDPALVRALQDVVPIRRAVAAEVLGHSYNSTARSAARKLLTDPKPNVRFRAARALAQRFEADAVAVLIDLLVELPPKLAQQVEIYLIHLAGAWAVKGPQGRDVVSQRLRREAWAAWWRTLDGPSLLEEFRKRTLSDSDRVQIQSLIQQLSDSNITHYENIIAAICKFGPRAAPLLRRVAADSDPKVLARIHHCLQLLESNALAPLPNLAARFMALRKPAGAAAVLLNYFPSAENENVAAEIREALAAIAIRDGKVEPALSQALADKEPLRRTVAAEVLCRVAGIQQGPALFHLLEDEDPEVRLRVAVALASVREKKAVPVLIGLLEKAPWQQAKQAEEHLYALANARAPDAVLDRPIQARQRCAAAWTAWWHSRQDQIDLSQLSRQQRQLGYTLLVEPCDSTRQTGRVLEVDRRGRVRWQMDDLASPMDAQWLAGDRVLIAEQNAMRVTERDLHGTIHWQKQVDQPIACQRLRNGHTFIATRGQLLVVDQAGKEVFSFSRSANDIISARRFTNGQTAFVTRAGEYIRLNMHGNERKNLHIAPIYYYNAYVDILPDDGLIVPVFQNHKVVEYDARGRVVWEAEVKSPISARRLVNGHTLVGTADPARVVELDRVGRIVWQCPHNVQPFLGYRR